MSRVASLRRGSSELGKLIKQSRKDKEMSLTDLARVSGLSRSYLGDIEAGRRGYSLPSHTISMLSQALDISESLIAQKMVGTDHDDTKKYGEYYRVLRSNVRAARIAQHLAAIREVCLQARSATVHGRDNSKHLQTIEKLVNSIDNTLAYRGKPPVSVQPGAMKGDEEKFLDGKLSGNG